MSHSIYDNTMNTVNTVSVTGPTPSPVYTTTGTGSSGLYWGMNGTSVGSGQVLTTNGTNPSWITTDPSLKGSSIQVKGNAEFDGDVTIKGKNLNDTLERIEERLAILRPNLELEEKWDQLRGLRKAYMELEQEIIEKEKVWKILKD
jgi:hypothetical protein